MGRTLYIKNFTERFDSLIFSYDRCTERLKAAMEAVAFATNARTGQSDWLAAQELLRRMFGPITL